MIDPFLTSLRWLAEPDQFGLLAVDGHVDPAQRQFGRVLGDDADQHQHVLADGPIFLDARRPAEIDRRSARRAFRRLLPGSHGGLLEPLRHVGRRHRALRDGPLGERLGIGRGGEEKSQRNNQQPAHRHSPRPYLSDPEARHRRLEPAAGPHRRDAQREAGGIIGLDRDAAECRHAGRRFEAP